MIKYFKTEFKVLIDSGIGWSLFAQIPIRNNCWNIRQKYPLPFTQRKIFIVNQILSYKKESDASETQREIYRGQ